ncbi:galactose mutarotase-like enzyme [Algoriphagus ratkowskyi]|nr:galactose mutarotase-like enzyme [Algoriphagus ratkowskyi]
MELSSIKSSTTGIEYIWQGDSAIWAGQAPVLFPIVGALKEGFTLIAGKKYEMPKHGLIRNSNKPKLIEQTDTFLRFRLTSDEESLQNYPFQFQFDMVFRLFDKTLTIEHHISNLGANVMLYSIGAHPAFNCPLREGEVYEDYSLEFAQVELAYTQLVDPSGLIGLNQRLVLDNTAKLPLHPHLFVDDALIFKQLKSREVTIKHKDKGDILSVNFEDFDYLGLWAKPEAPFVCIEPWLGIGDSSDSNHQFAEKDGIMKLEANRSEMKTYSITIIE